MTLADKTRTVKTMVGEDVPDTVLRTYLDISGAKILSRACPFDENAQVVPHRYDLLQCEIAAYLINKRGAEGETGHSENGISRSYENADIPESMMNAITPKVGVIKV